MESTTLALDIGDNATKLLEKLATQIGATADKVFPWLVRQQVIEGWTFFMVAGGIMVFLLFMAIVGVLLVRKDHDEQGIFLIIASAIVFLVAGLIISFEIPSQITKIMNPEYHALKEAASMVGQMTGK